MSVNFSAKSLQTSIQWLLECPVLLDHQQHPVLLASALPPASQPVVQDLTNSMEALQEELQGKRHHLLGVYYETLWQAIFRHLPDTQVISCNRQVQADKRTLGEFDLIYYCRIRKAYVHREMAVKFYLGLPDSDSLAGWFGPGLDDRFDRKVDRLLNHQSVLSQTPEGRHSLEALGITGVISEILLQGCLFYPFEGSLSAPTLLSDRHLHGDWLPVSALNHYIETRKIDAITHLNKTQWMTPPLNSLTSSITKADIHKIDWLHNSTTALFKQYRGPIMLAGLTSMDEQYCEASRFFLVPDDWENLARLRLHQ
ncbi:DUF1853 family protein [Kistimonas asteriae]|uniref:DUF1853 family protein n=1 Tax=Kistimonas asteriae TaxID=517724 RepID=UPI001BA9A40C|nr:DUF1853 family protein [Kistimonas asteriae]